MREGAFMACRHILVALLAFVAIGCASLPEIPYDRAASSDIKKIGILTPSIPKRAVAVLATSPGQSFGLIGGLVEASMRSAREDRLEAISQQRQFIFETLFMARVTEALQKHGYVVSNVPFTRQGTDLSKIYPKGPSEVDAYLDISVLMHGYVATGITTPWRPHVTLSLRLVRATDSSVLAQDSVIYNPFGPSKDVITIAPNPARQYNQFDDLIADAAGAVTGMHEATEASADAATAIFR